MFLFLTQDESWGLQSKQSLVGGAREMVQQLRMLAALPEDPSLVRSNQMVTDSCLELQLRGIWNLSWWLPQTPALAYSLTQTHIQRSKNKTVHLKKKKKPVGKVGLE